MEHQKGRAARLRMEDDTMMYSEFVKGTGCKENEHNYLVFKRLEASYMADDSMTKEEVYAWGMKLVDNSKSEAEKRLEEEIREVIEEKSAEASYYQREAEMEEGYASMEQRGSFAWKTYRADAKRHRETARGLRSEIALLKQVLA